MTDKYTGSVARYVHKIPLRIPGPLDIVVSVAVNAVITAVVYTRAIRSIFELERPCMTFAHKAAPSAILHSMLTLLADQLMRPHKNLQVFRIIYGRRVKLLGVFSRHFPIRYIKSTSDPKHVSCTLYSLPQSPTATNESASFP